MPEERSKAPARDEQPAPDLVARREPEPSQPDFLQHAKIPEREQSFHPSAPNRRGEIFAWISAVGMGMVLLLISYRTGGLRFLPLLLFLVFFTAGVMISFGNWMDSRTWVQVSPTGIQYQSPLRNVHLKWDQVRQAMVRRLGRGYRITVVGEGGYFRFRTGVVLRRNSAQGFDFGFPEGESLLGLILGGGKLTAISGGEGVWVCRRSEAEGSGG